MHYTPPISLMMRYCPDPPDEAVMLKQSFWCRVIAPLGKWITADNPPDAQLPAPEKTMSNNSLTGILGAGR